MILDYNKKNSWNDREWAWYFGCHVSYVRLMQEWLDRYFITTVCFNFATKKYSFVISRYIYDIKHNARLVRWKSTKEFDTRQDAINSGVNDLIPNLTLSESMVSEFEHFYRLVFAIKPKYSDCIIPAGPKGMPQMLKFKGKIR